MVMMYVFTFQGFFYCFSDVPDSQSSFCILVIVRTMSSVSSIQSLDLCVAYHSVAVTPLHLPIADSQ